MTNVEFIIDWIKKDLNDLHRFIYQADWLTVADKKYMLDNLVEVEESSLSKMINASRWYKDENLGQTDFHAYAEECRSEIRSLQQSLRNKGRNQEGGSK